MGINKTAATFSCSGELKRDLSPIPLSRVGGKNEKTTIETVTYLKKKKKKKRNSRIENYYPWEDFASGIIIHHLFNVK